MVASYKKRKSLKLDRLFFRRFWWCMKIVFPHWLSNTFLLFVLLLGLTLAEQMFIYNTGLIPSRFYEVLGERDRQGFKSLITLAFILIIGTALVKSVVQYVSDVMHVKWRGLLSTKLHLGYFTKDAYYKLNVLQDAIDNPDQRITQDVDRLCQQFSKIIAQLIISPFTIVYYTYQCYQSSGYLGPLSIYVYFIVGTIINRLIMSPIIELVVKQERLEGDFRFKHMQMRVNAEALAFYRSGSVEEKKTSSKLLRLLATQMRLVNFEFFLNFSVNFIDYVGSYLSYIIIAIALFGGMYDNIQPSALSGEISRNAFVSMYLISCFTKLIDLSNNVSDMAGYTHRIGELLEYLDENKEAKSVEPGPEIRPRNGCFFRLQNVSYGPPNSSAHLVEGLNLEIKTGKNLLITGCTGSGKSSLLRVLSGLWDESSGEVSRFISYDPGSLMFLPQKAFLTDGSLKQQIIYPHDEPMLQEYTDSAQFTLKRLDSKVYGYSPGSEDNDRIFSLLDTVGLTGLCDRVGHIDNSIDGNWEDMLSPGEMQRLSFARLFYHQPLVAVLDEATSALDIATEHAMYTRCRQLNITVVSVGHRESLIQYHDQVLRLDGNGGWSVNP